MLENSFTKVYRIRSAFEDDRDSLKQKMGNIFRTRSSKNG